MMKKLYFQPNTEIVLLHADANLCDLPDISQKAGPVTNVKTNLGIQKVPGVSVYRSM